MEVVIDSHTLFWFLADNPKLSIKARNLIKDARKVIVPSIVLAIVATANMFNAPLISKDTIIKNTYPKTIW